MLKIDIAYKDLDDNDAMETCYFNISMPELVELGEDLSEKLTKVVAQGTGKQIMSAFQHLISLTYGERSEDNKRFSKNALLTADFMTSPVYEALFMRLLTEPGFAAEFITGVFPKNLQEKAEKLVAGVGTQDEKPIERDIESYSEAELANMPIQEFMELGERNKHHLTKEYMVVGFRRTN